MSQLYSSIRSAKQFSKGEYEALAAFRYKLRQFLRFSEEAAKTSGITPQQHQALLAIKGFPLRDSVTISELAERLQLRHHSAVGLIDRLVEEKLVLRKPSSKDRRAVLIQLTSRGEKMLGTLSFAHSKQLKQLGPALKKLLARLGPLKN